ncbi:hypothetical protein [Celeribacter sp.]|uniref:hypothetical protein n=1 Tax=Celeribacter sp. TaxID=1890673 RepID=UPI003A8E71BF
MAQNTPRTDGLEKIARRKLSDQLLDKLHGMIAAGVLHNSGLITLTQSGNNAWLLRWPVTLIGQAMLSGQRPKT